jgi:hypothetical protein
MRRQQLIVLCCGACMLLLAACGGASKEVNQARSQSDVAAIRSRSADAFEELGAAQRGDMAPPKQQPEAPAIKPAAIKPELPKPPQQKPIDTINVNPSRIAPEWVNSQPQMEGYYIGIGVSTSHGIEEDDWARARNAAYIELSSTLKVHINSVIHDYFKENNVRLYDKDNLTKDTARQDSSYAQDTSFFVDQTLEGVEIYDRWKDTAVNKYWMLTRLSKAEIARRLREQLERARTKAVDYVQAAIQAESEGRVAEAYRGYFRSYLALREYFGGIVEYDLNGDGKPDVLNHEIERLVARLSSDLSWQVANPNLTAVIGSGIDEPLSVAVAFKSRPVRGLPVAFGFQRGTGTVEGRVSTGDDGVASAKVVKIFGDKQAIIGARVDVDASTENAHEAAVVEAKFGTALSLKTGKFFIALEELSAHIAVKEENLGDEVRPGTIAADLKSKLHRELGIVFTNSAQGADLEITGVATTGSCTNMYNKRLCTAEVNVTVSDHVRERQLFSEKYKISGTGENDKEAGLDALRKVGPRIANEIIEKMK